MLDAEFSYAVTQGEKDGTTILTLQGPFTLGNMFQLQSDLRALKPQLLIVDLTGVPYMDSAGLGVIMNGYVSAQNDGRKFLLAGVNTRIRALLESTRVDTVLQISDTVQTAQALA